MEFIKGMKFTGKWFTGVVEVLEVKGNDLEAKLKSNKDSDHHWFETWNLSHTKIGFKNMDYFFDEKTTG